MQTRFSVPLYLSVVILFFSVPKTHHARSQFMGAFGFCVGRQLSGMLNQPRAGHEGMPSDSPGEQALIQRAIAVI